MDPRNEETHLVFATVIDSGKLYSYQTVHFTVTYRRGVKCIFILYSYDTNAVLSEPLKNRTRKDILHLYNTYHDYLKERGFNHKIYWFDNKASNDLKKDDMNQGVDTQLFTSWVHGINPAER